MSVWRTDYKESDRLRLVMRKDLGVWHRGKRVGANCPVDAETRRLYVKEGPISAVKRIRDTKNVGLKEAYDIFQEARYGRW